MDVLAKSAHSITLSRVVAAADVGDAKFARDEGRALADLARDEAVGPGFERVLEHVLTAARAPGHASDNSVAIADKKRLSA